MSLRPTGEAADVVALEDVKQHLRVDYDDDDTYIGSLISAATTWIGGQNGWLGKSLSRQTWELSLDAFPREKILLPMPPLVSVDGIEYVDTDGNTQEYSDFRAFGVESDESGYVLPSYGEAWPETRNEPEAVKIAFTAGPQTVDVAIKQAILLLISGWYANRESVSDRPSNALPFGVDALLMPHRNWSV